MIHADKGGLRRWLQRRHRGLDRRGRRRQSPTFSAPTFSTAGTLRDGAFLTPVGVPCQQQIAGHDLIQGETSLGSSDLTEHKLCFCRHLAPVRGTVAIDGHACVQQPSPPGLKRRQSTDVPGETAARAEIPLASKTAIPQARGGTAREDLALFEWARRGSRGRRRPAAACAWALQSRDREARRPPPPGAGRGHDLPRRAKYPLIFQSFVSFNLLVDYPCCRRYIQPHD
jgi:hypothetical protein